MLRDLLNFLTLIDTEIAVQAVKFSLEFKNQLHQFSLVKYSRL